MLLWKPKLLQLIFERALVAVKSAVESRAMRRASEGMLTGGENVTEFGLWSPHFACGMESCATLGD